MVLLPIVFVLKLPDAFVAHVLTLSVLVPWLLLARRMVNRDVGGWQRWSRWDYNYCGKFVVATLFANQLGAVDIVIASVLFPSATVADYAVAARLAALFTFFEQALLKRFAPRAGRLLQIKDKAGLHREFDMCRRLAIGCVALTTAGRAAVGADTVAASWQLPGCAHALAVARHTVFCGRVLRDLGSAADHRRPSQCGIGGDGFVIRHSGGESVRDGADGSVPLRFRPP